MKKVFCGSVISLFWNACDMIENIDTFNEVELPTSIGSGWWMALWMLSFPRIVPKLERRKEAFFLTSKSRPTHRVLLVKMASSSSVIVTHCIFSCVAINEPIPHQYTLLLKQGEDLPMKVVTKRLLTWQISSGTNQIVAPIFLAILILSLAFIYASSSDRPGVTRS